MPRPGLAAEENSRLCCVYFRPWTLNKRDVDQHVPHLLQLAQVPSQADKLQLPPTGVGKRLRCKTNFAVALCLQAGERDSAAAAQIPQSPSWASAWKFYIGGHVVSDHAARVIKNVLTSTLARTADQDDSSDEERDDEAGTREWEGAEPFRPSLDSVHAILRAECCHDDEASKASRMGQEHVRTIRRSRVMWASSGNSTSDAVDAVDTSGNRPSLHVPMYCKLARKKQQGAEQLMPYDGVTAPAASLYSCISRASVQQWLQELCVPRLEVVPFGDLETSLLACLVRLADGSTGAYSISAADVGFAASWNAAHPERRLKKGDQLAEVNGVPVSDEGSLAAALMVKCPPILSFSRACPNQQQLAVLKHVAERLQQEWLEERTDSMATSNDDPLFELVHGLPGTGKSRVIGWIRELFTDVAGWTHGSQFVCLAFQNTMAANINGSTIHSWAGIPAFHDEYGRAQGARDIGALFTRCQNLRWILLDEPSMVSAELLAELERRTTQASRGTGTYKQRPDKSVRPFGGFNVLLFGDWWQLRPVKQTPLFEQPSKAPSGAAYEGCQLLWGRTRDSLHRVWELTQPMRCDDPFYCGFLSECRNGNLSRDTYFFIHGAPTEVPGSSVSGEERPRCGSAKCLQLQTRDWPKMFQEGAVWAAMQAQECEICASERLARARVAASENDARFRQHPFDGAPYIHPNNLPKYAALQQRALLYAQTRGLCVHWVVAHDRPLHQDDVALSEEALNKKRLRWLTFHDQQTAGIMGLLPLVRGMPMRLTDTVNRDRGLFKHRRCVLSGWTLHPDEASVVEGGERNLQHHPHCLYLEFQGASWQVGDLEPGVYPLEPDRRDWVLCEKTKMKARRTGFRVVPDFSATSHMLQGATLAAAIADCLEAAHVSRLADMLAAYVGLSRAKLKETMLITQPFSPGLFSHGPPPGPHILMRVLRGEIQPEDVDTEFEKLRRRAVETCAEKDLMRMRWPCKSCLLAGRQHHKGMKEFNVHRPADFISRLLPQGAWTRCSLCTRASSGPLLNTSPLANPATTPDEERDADTGIYSSIASLAVQRCSTCSIERGKAEFWEQDWARRGGEQISCMACQPQLPAERGTGRGHLSEALIQRNAAVYAKELVCTMCEQTLPRDSFWPYDVDKKYAVPLGCKSCKPIPPHERKAAANAARAAARAADTTFLCDLCGLTKGHGEFWHYDLKHRWGHALGCKLCKPVAPEDRKRQAAKDRAKAKLQPQVSVSSAHGVETGSTSAGPPLRKRRRTKGPDVVRPSCLPGQAESNSSPVPGTADMVPQPSSDVVAAEPAQPQQLSDARGALAGTPGEISAELAAALAMPEGSPAARLRKDLAIKSARRNMR